jgi:DNA-binding NarL/FixJ family response regulator
MEDDIEVVGSSLSGVGVYEQVIENKADVIILDINMPDLNGIGLLNEFQEKGRPCEVVVLSSHEDIKIIKEVIKLGAKSYLTKGFAGDNITHAVRKVYNGEKFFGDDVKEKMLTSFTNNELESDHKKSITKRELEILQLVVKEYTTKEIGEKLFISNNTVDTHRKNIMRKLEVKNTVGLVKYAIKNEMI